MVAKSSYIPDVGDICWLNFDPQAGHEQKGHRPALVLSPMEYNKKTGLMICCPMTTEVKGYPFEVVVAKDSVVLVDQIKSLAFRERKAEKKSRVSNGVLTEVRTKLALLLELE